MNRHFHFIDNYTDPRINLSILTSTEFENIIYQRKEYLTDILSRRNEASKFEKTIDKIIELSNRND